LERRCVQSKLFIAGIAANVNSVDQFNVACKLLENVLQSNVQCRQFCFATNRKPQQVRIRYLLTTRNQRLNFSYGLSEGQIVRPKKMRGVRHICR
jgi:hypothetical protein